MRGFAIGLCHHLLVARESCALGCFPARAHAAVRMGRFEALMVSVRTGRFLTRLILRADAGARPGEAGERLAAGPGKAEASTCACVNAMV